MTIPMPHIIALQRMVFVLRRQFLAFAHKVYNNLPMSYPRFLSSHSKGLRRFLKKEYVNKVTGEEVDSADLMPMIDEAKLAGWQVLELPGEYYQVLKPKGDDIFAILKAFGMELKQQLYTRARSAR